MIHRIEIDWPEELILRLLSEGLVELALTDKGIEVIRRYLEEE